MKHAAAPPTAPPARPGLIRRYFPRRYKRVRAILIIIAVLVVIRILLPYIVLHFVNKRLANMPGYYGHVEDVDLAIIRGAYALNGAYLDKVDSVTNQRTPFLAADRIDLSVEWRALFQGEVVGEVIFDKLIVKFTKDKAEPGQVGKDEDKFKALKEDFMPLRVNRLQVINGSIHYIDQGSSPPVDIKADKVYLVARNLSNVQDTSLLPSRAVAYANIYGGDFRFSARMDLLADRATFDINTDLRNVNLVELNEFFQAYAKIDVNEGSFGLYAEAAARDGAYTGYVKPIIKNLDVLGREDRQDNALRVLWEGLVGFVGEVVTNQRKDQVATKVPFEGTISGASTNVWYAIMTVLQNAFIQALQPSIDNEINLASVGEGVDDDSPLKGLFKKKDKDEKGRNKDRAKKLRDRTPEEKAADERKREQEREKAKEERQEKREERRKEREAERVATDQD